MQPNLVAWQPGSLVIGKKEKMSKLRFIHTPSYAFFLSTIRAPFQLALSVSSFIMVSFYLKWTFTEYKELLSIGLNRNWQIVLNDVLLMVPFLESVHLNSGYLREQFLVPFYFLFTSTICQTA